MSSGFKAIIVGAGPTGLCAAHAFALAEIPFVVLEKRKGPITGSGAVFALFPQTFRVLDQLGLMEDALKIVWGEIKNHVGCIPGGKVVKENDVFRRYERKWEDPLFQAPDDSAAQRLTVNLQPWPRTKILSAERPNRIPISEASGPR
jgi:2-polyprenyl-6-methoxyphenol hydroxylase-like FAD-dependent oxidoreductase